MATTTPNYGWSVPTSSDYVAQGAVAIETLGDSADATLFTALGGTYPGLRLIKKQTIGTGVSSVAVTSAFSATYENYKIVVSGGTGSAVGELLLKLTGITTSYYTQLQYNSYGSTTPLAASSANIAYFNWAGTCSSNGLNMDVSLNNPFLAKFKTFFAPFVILQVAGGVSGMANGLCASTSSATGFTIEPNTGTLTGGTIYVYGYGAS
jgi:hypothetical protein